MIAAGKAVPNRSDEGAFVDGLIDNNEKVPSTKNHAQSDPIQDYSA